MNLKKNSNPNQRFYEIKINLKPRTKGFFQDQKPNNTNTYLKLMCVIVLQIPS